MRGMRHAHGTRCARLSSQPSANTHAGCALRSTEYTPGDSRRRAQQLCRTVLLIPPPLAPSLSRCSDVREQQAVAVLSVCASA